MKKIVITSGYFDPIHKGHVECLKLARELGTELVVILNSDHQAIMKKGKPFMSQDERMEIVKAIRYVDDVFMAIDQDKSVVKSLEAIAQAHPNDELIFAKGGDRFGSEIPEAEVCQKYKIKIVDGLGAKVQSSSALTGLKEIK